MIQVLIDDEISPYWGIAERDIAKTLKDAKPGEEIEISINSPGGDVCEGVAIFNLIRDYAKSHPVSVKITGLAASMASYIAIAPRTVNKDSKVTVSENSMYFIHNPWNVMAGDYRAMAKEAEILERLAGMVSSTYSFVSGKADSEIRSMMDDNTWFIGNDIMTDGFANNFEQINKPENDDTQNDSAQTIDRNTLIVNAKLAIDKTREKLRGQARNDLDKAVALLANDSFYKGFLSVPLQTGMPAGSVMEKLKKTESKDKSETEGGVMNKEELKAKHPELYAAMFEEGREEGTKKERERAEAHLKLGEEAGAFKVAAQFIREGKSIMEDKVQAEYMSARMNMTALHARNGDDPPPLGTAGAGGAHEDAALEEAWKNGLAGKDAKGRSI